MGEDLGRVYQHWQSPQQSHVPPPRPSRLRSRAIPILGFVILAAGSLLALRRADAAFGPPVPEAPPPRRRWRGLPPRRWDGAAA